MLGELFDPKADTEIYEHCRPHWSQAGAVVFITFRLAIRSREVLERWDREKQEWLRVRGYGGRISAMARTCYRNWPSLIAEDSGEFNRCRRTSSIRVTEVAFYGDRNLRKSYDAVALRRPAVSNG